MPFTENWILDKISDCHRAGRLAHAYLLTGSDSETLQHLAMELCKSLLGKNASSHSDFHCVRPESKSRRLTVAQIRELERELQLKSREGGLKIGLIYCADRMCLGKAESANAFLKTLEEPPAHTVIFLTSDRPDQLLPTIRSRCITLPLDTSDIAPVSNADKQWAESWIAVQGTPVRKAYKRCQILSQWWQEIRNEVESDNKSISTGEETDSAQLESEFLLKRDNALALLIREIWKRNPKHQINHEYALSCLYLEELRSAMQRNVEQNLALERCHLKVAQQVKQTLMI